MKSPSSLAINKKARHLYDLSDFLEAGIALTGPEVKSIRNGKVNFIDSYVEFKEGQAWLLSLHIAPYANASCPPESPARPRRLLLHAREISKLSGLVLQKGLTVIPTRLYLKRGKIKVEIALGRGKKLYDHRETLKKNAIERELDQSMRGKL